MRAPQLVVRNWRISARTSLRLVTCRAYPFPWRGADGGAAGHSHKEALVGATVKLTTESSSTDMDIHTMAAALRAVGVP
jgi:hypothetical protein